MSVALMALFLAQLDLIPTFVLTLSLVTAGIGIVAMMVSER
jgi:hypothetical protein